MQVLEDTPSLLKVKMYILCILNVAMWHPLYHAHYEKTQGQFHANVKITMEK